MQTTKVNPSVPAEFFDYTKGETNAYYGKWTGERYGRDVYSCSRPVDFPTLMDGDVVVLFDMRTGHIGYLGALWTTNTFENDGLYPYVAETETHNLEIFEYYQDAVKWLQAQH